MTVYVYRCPQHGVLEAVLAMGTAAASLPCPDCGAAARRVFTAPRLRLGSATRRALLDRTERSADEPAVVSTLPAPTGGARRADLTRNPALGRLPRP